LNTIPRYFLKKEDKLKSRKAIDELFKTGKSFSNFPLKVIWIPENRAGILQAGVGVSSRNFKKAVDRNRIKRLLREAWRLQKGSLHQHLEENGLNMTVFILYVGKELPPFELIYDKVGTVTRRLIQWNNGKTETNT
jgi:ribonuclease P protein component